MDLDPLTRHALIRALTAFAAVLVIGTTGVFAVGALREQGQVQPSGSVTPSSSVSPAAGPETETWLTWVPGGLPDAFGSQLSIVPAVGDVSVATADVAWMTGSVDGSGVAVDTPTSPYMIPIDATGVDPAYASFIPEPERRLVADLQLGEGILSQSEANLRGLGEGATLTFETGQIVAITGILPDHLMGSYELLTTRTTAETIGVTHERYVLFHLKPNASAVATRLASLFLPYIPPDHPYGVAEVRAPGETRYLRANDRELPPVLLKQRFGEFTAYPGPEAGGQWRIDPAWIDAHILTRKLPVLGETTCHEKALDYLEGVMAQLVEDGDEDLITQGGGCYEPLASVDDPSGPFTARPFGAVIDLNEDVNDPGEEPVQDPTLIKLMYRGGFSWGGRDLYPLGMRFRYVHRPSRAD
jgi:hypothetical protein